MYIKCTSNCLNLVHLMIICYMVANHVHSEDVCQKSYCLCSRNYDRKAVVCLPKTIITSIPRGVPEDTKELSFLSNHIQAIGETDLKRLEDLIVLSLADNQISDIHEKAFKNMYSLQVLLLQGNRISVIKKGHFTDLTSIRVLNLSRNPIRQIAHFAFSTFPLKSKVKVLLSNNLTYCGCALLKSDFFNSQAQPGLSFNGCTYVPQKSSAASRKCADKDDPIRGSNQCFKCFGELTNGKCVEEGTIEKCGDDSLMMCATVLRYRSGNFHITRGCRTYHWCMEYMQKNALECSLRFSPNSINCTYCCIGDLCNDRKITSRTLDVSYYISFQVNIYEYNIQKPDEYKTLAELIRAKIKMGFPGSEYSVVFKAFRSPGLQFYYTIHVTKLQPSSQAELDKAVLPEINKSIHSIFNTSILNDSDLKITHDAFAFCEKDETLFHDSVLFWMPTIHNTKLTINCSWTPPGFGIRTTARFCRLVTEGMAKWDPPDLDSCNDSIAVLELKILHNSEITEKNALNVSQDLKRLSVKMEKHNPYQVKLIVDIAENIFKMTKNTDEKATTNVLDAVNTMLDFTPEAIVESQEKDKTSYRLISAVEFMVKNIPLKKGPFLNLGKKLSVACVELSTVVDSGIAFSSKEVSNKIQITNPKTTPTDDMSLALVLPDKMFKSLNTSTKKKMKRIGFTIYHDAILFADPETLKQNDSTNITTQINSRIISATIPNISLENLEYPIVISFPHLKQDARNPHCMFWKYNPENDAWGWADDGCTVNITKANYTQCTCDHLTNFALIMDIYPHKPVLTELDKKALSAISYIGCGLSLSALIFTILTYLMFRRLRRDIPSKILINLCFALFNTNLIFVAGMQDYTFHDLIACKVVAVLMHYFLLSSLTWMAVEAVNMYLSLVIVFKLGTQHFLVKCMIIGWGAPLIIVLITLFNGIDSYGFLGSGICWLVNPFFYYSFLAPVAFILLMNCIAFGMVLRELFGVAVHKSTNTSLKVSTLQRLRGAVVIIVLLGLTYMFAIFAIDQASVVFYYLFAIFNSLQGVFIFIFYCVLKKDALNAWKRKLGFGEPEADEYYYATSFATKGKTKTKQSDIDLDLNKRPVTSTMSMDESTSRRPLSVDETPLKRPVSSISAQPSIDPSSK